MTAMIKKHRAPYEKELGEVLGKADGLLYRRGNFNGTLDDVICDGILEQRDAQIALSPGIRWGTSILPGGDITFEDVTNATAMTYPNCYRMEMSGERLKAILEDVADNIFNPDPYYQQGGDMVRTGGLGFTIAVDKPMGSRISGMTLLKTGETIDAGKNYVVSGWASINQGTEGPPVWDVVSKHIKAHKTVGGKPSDAVKVIAN
jgi:sulfur-oxidizing protein SoxB